MGRPVNLPLTKYREFMVTIWTNRFHVFASIRAVFCNFKMSPIPEVRIFKDINVFMTCRALAI